MKSLNVATTINPRFDHVTPIEATRSDVTITHRCHVMAELLAVARSGLVDLVLIANDLELVTLETLQQLTDGDGYGPKVVAISDINGDRERLQQLGVPAVSPQLTGDELVHWLQTAYLHDDITADISHEFSHDELRFLHDVDPDQSATVTKPTGQSATRRPSGRRAAPYDPATDVPEEVNTAQYAANESGEPTKADTMSSEDVPGQRSPKQASLGQVTAVWGPIGAPGVTTVAVNMAVESALFGYRTLLIDADTYGAAVAAHLGLLDETAAIAQACRTADHRGIDADELAKFTEGVTVQGAKLFVLTGLTRSERWPQLRAAAWLQVLEAARAGWDHVIIDCGFGLEEDEELSFDIPAPQRNATTLTAVETANTIVAVGTGDPVGFARFIKGLEHLTEIAQTTIIPVVNKVSATASGAGPKRQLAGVWQRFGPSLQLEHFIGWAPESTAAALLAGKAFAENAAKSQIRQSIANLASACLSLPVVANSQVHNRSSRIQLPKAKMRRMVGGLKRSLTRTK